MFSIIIPFYQGTQTDEELDRCLESVEQQHPALCEVILLHDGPLLRPCKYPIVDSAKRKNDWGHSLRDTGMNIASGEYIVHLNADNILYPQALDDLGRIIEDSDHAPIYILALVMNGSKLEAGKLERNGEGKESLILPGIPKVGSIDAMQLVMKRELWMKYGGWYDKSISSDGNMYERFCKEHKPVYVKLLMGEHN